MTDDEKRALIRGWLDRERDIDPQGPAAAILWRVCNVLYRDGDPALPEPLTPGFEDRA